MKKRVPKKKTKKLTSAEKLATRQVNVEILQLDRLQAITNLSLAILETAKALNTPSVMIRNNTFLGGSPALQISTKKKK